MTLGDECCVRGGIVCLIFQMSWGLIQSSVSIFEWPSPDSEAEGDHRETQIKRDREIERD